MCCHQTAWQTWKSGLAAPPFTVSLFTEVSPKTPENTSVDHFNADKKNVDNIRTTKVLEGWFRSDHVMTEDQWGHMGQITPNSIVGCFVLPTSGHWFSVVIVHDVMDWTHSSLFLMACYFPCWWHKESFPCDMFNSGSVNGCLHSFQRVRG